LSCIRLSLSVRHARKTTSRTMSSARGATKRLARMCASYAGASARPRLAGFGGPGMTKHRLFAAQAAVENAQDDIGPVTLDFAKLVTPGESPSAAYARLAARGVLRPDDAQRDAITVLDALHSRLVGTDDSDDASASSSGGRANASNASRNEKKEGSWFSDLFTSSKSDPRPDASHVPHSGGVYLHGGPGCGKTFVMDLAYACLPGECGAEKKREHFHSFMLATHHALHKLGKATSGHSSASRDTVALYAADIARKTTVLCLDEFQIVDVADAMIIRRLLDQLWARGVTLVATSNRAPNELYKNGLNRAQFVPCIEAILAKCAVHEMQSGRDYRLTGHSTVDVDAADALEADSTRRLSGGATASSGGLNPLAFRGKTWVVAPPGDSSSLARADEWLTTRLTRLAKNDRMVAVDVALNGRRVRIQKASGGVARLSFHEACASNLGAGDYTAVASVFHTVGLENIPIFSTDRIDLMRRFITFVDVMYEHKVKLLATAADVPKNLFPSARGGGASELDEAFAWERCASRLAEMSSSEYVEAAWRPKSGAWLLEQAKVLEVVPEGVLRSLWQRYDADHNGVLDESELECLLGDLNELRRGHRNVPREQLASAWEVLTNRGKRGIRQGQGLGTVDSVFETCHAVGGPMQKAAPSRKGDAFIAFDDFIDYGNEAFAARGTTA